MFHLNALPVLYVTNQKFAHASQITRDAALYCTNCTQVHISILNPLNTELNPICYLLALLGAHHFLHVSRIRVKSLTLRLLKSYIYIYIWSTYS